jgi:NAD(P)-dependent dehydrogenase (short-subunit alcohol dehydrogenase family)
MPLPSSPPMPLPFRPPKSRSRQLLITGCSSGIGRALALAFHQQGHRVWATARNPETLADLKAQGIRTAQLDVTDAASRDAAVQQILAESGTIDILINNAGYGLMGPLLELTPEELRAQFETNQIAPMALVQAVAPSMIAQGSGLIVNIGSVSGLFTTPFAGAYCASKAALHSLSDALRLELAPFGIQVMVIQPGAIQSSIGHNAEALLAQTLKADSRYGALEQVIRDRANASQQGSTPTEVFAQAVVKACQHPKPIVRIGNKSFLLPFLQRWLPGWMRDRLLTKRFQLHQLQNR